MTASGQVEEPQVAAEPEGQLVETRRARLKEWFAHRSMPMRAGHLAKLMRGDAPFGEGVARRLEKDYKMPPGYLDGEGTVPAMTFGDKIRRLRIEGRLTQGQLAAHIGVTQTAVAAWENGVREVTTDNLLKLAEVLGFDASELAGNARKPLGDTEELRLLAAFRALPKGRRPLAIKLMEALVTSGLDEEKQLRGAG